MFTMRKAKRTPDRAALAREGVEMLAESAESVAGWHARLTADGVPMTPAFLARQHRELTRAKLAVDAELMAVARLIAAATPDTTTTQGG